MTIEVLSRSAVVVGATAADRKEAIALVELPALSVGVMSKGLVASNPE